MVDSIVDSSCLLVRVLLMLIVTSGDGVIGTSDVNAYWYVE